MPTETQTEPRISEAELEQLKIEDYINQLAKRLVEPPIGQEIVEAKIVRHIPTEDQAANPDYEIKIRQYLGTNGKPITELFASTIISTGRLTLTGTILGKNFPNPSLAFSSNGKVLSGSEAIEASQSAINAGYFPDLNNK